MPSPTEGRALARTGARGATTCWALVGLAVSPLAAHRVLPAQPLTGPITAPSAVRSLTAAFAAPAPPPVCRYLLDFLLRFRMWCLVKLLDFSAWPDAKRQSPVARSCQHRSRTKGPFLHRHYPASPVLRPYPPPQGAGSVPHDTTVGQHRLPATPRGFPCCTQPLFRTCRRHYPGGTVGCLRRSPSPTAAAFPQMKTGRLPHCGFRGLLSVHCTLRPIRSLNPLRTLLHRNASAASLPPRPFRLLPAGTTLAGWDSHPLRLCTFARRTSSPQATRACFPVQAGASLL